MSGHAYCCLELLYASPHVLCVISPRRRAFLPLILEADRPSHLTTRRQISIQLRQSRQTNPASTEDSTTIISHPSHDEIHDGRLALLSLAHNTGYCMVDVLSFRPAGCQKQRREMSKESHGWANLCKLGKGSCASRQPLILKQHW